MRSSGDKPTILVVGGAGYIGSHVNQLLHERGYPTVVLDNLASGARHAVMHGEFVHGNMGDLWLVSQLLRKHPIRAVMLLAASARVSESVRHPSRYYQNNVCNTLSLLETTRAAKVEFFVYSSSAAIYGRPITARVDESHPKSPISPYGRTKWMVEQILSDLAQQTTLKYCALRFFNAAGADPERRLRLGTLPPQNLIPIALHSILTGEGRLTLYGDNYPTKDGSCVRDYVHVQDLAEAHLLALEHLLSGGSSSVYNLGTGRGHSVKEVLQTIESITGQKLHYQVRERRVGDPPTLVAYSEKAKLELGWQPRYPDLPQIIEHAWRAIQ